MSINEALIDAVKALGGSKQVGPVLWPEKAPDAAQRALLDCLNDDRPAHLTPAQMVLVMRMGRDKGIHSVMEFLCEVLSYSAPVPLEPRDEADDLRRQILEMGAQLQQTLERLNSVDARARLKAA